MEKHRCKLCHRNFANGRALGGHMRSHVMNMNLYASSKAKPGFIEEDDDQTFMSEEIESVPTSSSSSSEDEDEGEEEKGLFSYGVMSNNHRNFKRRSGVGMEDSDQFCFVRSGGGSVVLQDRESETESSKNPLHRRSKRVRKSRISEAIQFSDYTAIEKAKTEKQSIIPPEFVPSTEAEPVSSISDTTPEEDVAHCLMMLSRDKWRSRESEEEQEDEEDLYSEEKENEFDVVKVATKSPRSSRGKYRCETCNKVFRSYQALGGHRASHKRIKVQNNSGNSTEEEARNAANVVEEKIHECPVCYRVFSSGQALGGHKRSHVMGSAAVHQQISTFLPAPKNPPFSRFGESLIDLNLPAPVDDDDISQIEHSAISDAEFVNPFKH